MNLKGIFFLFAAVTSSVSAAGQARGHGSNIGEYGDSHSPPKPYSFNYQITDDYGNTQFRREQGDSSGSVSGTYGYTNINGLYRTVEYVSNAEGFKAQVKTNEPGVGSVGSADVHLTAEPSPPGLVDMFTRKIPAAVPPVASGRTYPGNKRMKLIK